MRGMDCTVLKYLRIRSIGSQCTIIQITEKSDALVVAPEDVPRGG